ncbi:MAG: sulfatase, partial [Spirochaetales bacterium]
MKRSRLYLALIIAAAAGFLVYILFPLTSRKWDLKEDPGALEAKKKALDASADTVKMSGRAAGPAGRRPNIIILLADDLGKTEISLYRGRKVETPNIDSIGRQGVIFTNAYCTASICSPSRSSLLTGRYQQRFGNELQIAERYPLNRIEYFMYKYFVPTGRWKVRDLERYPSKKQMAKQGPPLSEILLPELLKTAGYRTGITGKWHQGWAEEMVPGSRGFDYQYGFYEAYSLY